MVYYEYYERVTGVTRLIDPERSTEKTSNVENTRHENTGQTSIVMPSNVVFNQTNNIGAVRFEYGIGPSSRAEQVSV